MSSPVLPRNVILISLDTLRHDCISSQSSRHFLQDLSSLVSTPTIDQLAKEGVSFSTCISSCPLTTPSHAAMFTGMYWPKHQVFHQFETPMSKRAYPIAERLKKNKFLTIQNAGRALGEGAMFQSKYTGLSRGYAKSYFASELQPEVIKLLAKQRDPWYLFFHTFNVHWPYGMSPEAFDCELAKAWETGNWDGVRRIYIENSNRVDSQLAELLSVLNSTGQSEDTLIVFTADHGEGLNSRVPMHGAVNGGLEEVIRVPLIFHHPRSIQGGKTVDLPVRTIDIVPTILNLLGVSNFIDPENFDLMDGRSLWPLMKGEFLDERPACFCCFTYDYETDKPFLRGVRTSKWKLILNECTQREIDLFAKRISAKSKKDWPLKDELRLEGMRDILKRESFLELYDLLNDPLEIVNVAENNPEVVASLVSELAQVDKGVTLKDFSNKLSDSETEVLRKQLVDLGYLV